MTIRTIEMALTAAAVPGWTLWRTTTEPDLWQQLGDEADRVLGPTGQTAPSPDERTLAQLGLTDRAMRESLRLQAAIDVEIGGYTIPARTMPTSTVPEPVGVAVNRPAGGVPMRLREREIAHDEHVPTT